MKIAVTGGNGRVGRAVIGLALQEGHSVVCIDITAPGDMQPHDRLGIKIADCADYHSLRAAISGCDALIHLAAIPAPGQHPDHVIHNNNVVGSYNALCAAADLGIRRVCQASSVNAVGLAFSRRARFDYFPIDEKHPNYCEEPYSLSKWICEQQADSFARRHAEMRIASLRFHIVVAEKKIAADIYNANYQDTDKHLWGYTLSSSAARTCLLGLQADFSGHEVFYIAESDSTHPRPSRDLAMEFFPEVPGAGDFTGHQSFFRCDKAKRLLGWAQR